MKKLISRRKAIGTGSALAAGSMLLRNWATPLLAADEQPPATNNGESAGDYTPVITPNGVTLPWKMVDGVKVFHLIVNEFEHEFAPGLKAKCWGYNGHTPGPTIEAVEGDRVRFYVTNQLPEATSIHWHGILVPNGMDGVAGLTQKPIPPGETYVYEFTLRNHGTHMYHSHFDEMTQIALGTEGMFIIHPKETTGPKVDRDFALMLSEWSIPPGWSRPNPLEMTDFNIFTINSKAFPGCESLVVKQGQRVRIRIGNLGPMDHHPIHLHGFIFAVTEIDGGDVPSSQQTLQDTILVPVGATRAFEFIADEPGDWSLHCHMTHHTMNQMGHNALNMIGVDTERSAKKVASLLPGYMSMGEDGMGMMSMMSMPLPKNSISMMGSDGPGGTIDMGGMFTIVKVRKDITTYADPGWYQHPPGTQATTATPDQLKREGIEIPTKKT
jgi:FtsP/CotA-like multicopper oxidase with cupredoxin domain